MLSYRLTLFLVDKQTLLAIVKFQMLTNQLIYGKVVLTI